MPGRNGTGPQGMGPMTGRGAGVCTGHAPQGYGYAGGFGRGCGMGMGRGAGRGRRNQFYATGVPGWMRGGMASGAAPMNPAPTQELDALKRQA